MCGPLKDYVQWLVVGDYPEAPAIEVVVKVLHCLGYGKAFFLAFGVVGLSRCQGFAGKGHWITGLDQGDNSPSSWAFILDLLD